MSSFENCFIGKSVKMQNFPSKKKKRMQNIFAQLLGHQVVQHKFMSLANIICCT